MFGSRRAERGGVSGEGRELRGVWLEGTSLFLKGVEKRPFAQIEGGGRVFKEWGLMCT